MAAKVNHNRTNRKGWGLLIKKWIKNPAQVGTILPSSVRISRIVARYSIASLKGGKILELGAGTGPFSQAILDAGLPPDRLICVEKSKDMCDFLRKKLSGVNVIQADACYLSEQIPADVLRGVDCVVSSIPMLCIPKSTQSLILQSVFNTIGDVPLYQITYKFFSSSIDSDAFGLTEERLAKVWLNMPPVTLWKYMKASIGQCAA